MTARPPAYLVTFAWLLAVVSSVLAFTQLGTKVYWHDEAYTSLRVFGHTGPEYYHGLFDGEVHTLADLQYYQHEDPALGIDATLKALESRPEHPPLYFLLGRLWSGLFEDPVVALRSLAAVFAVLMLPAVFWFSRELFADPRVAWVALALMASSPLHLVYAQEARQYSLWCLLVLLSGAALLRALRYGERRHFIVYALTVVLGLYTQIMFALTLLAQVVYLVLQRKQYPPAAVRGCAWSLAVGALLFTPWAALFLGAMPDVAVVISWMQRPLATPTLMLSWLTSLNRVFFDFPGSGYLVPVSSGLVLTALFLLVRRTPARVWLLPVLLLATAAVVMVPDLLDGGRRSLETRYLLPALWSLELCVAWLIGRGITLPTLAGRLTAVAALLLVIGGIASQRVILSSGSWWNKSFSGNNAALAAVINQADKPLLISTLGEVNPGELLSLSHLLQDQVQLLLLGDYALPELPAGYDHYIILHPPWDEAQAQQRGYTLQRLTEDYALWEIRRRDAR
jgi:uncharacterized membrane protein